MPIHPIKLSLDLGEKEASNLRVPIRHFVTPLVSGLSTPTPYQIGSVCQRLS